MSLALYMDEQVQSAIALALVGRGVDVVSAQSDGMTSRPDVEILDRALTLRRVVFTRDEDFLREATYRQRQGRDFFGVIYAHQKLASIRQCIDYLELAALTSEPDDLRNRVQYVLR
jgi:hypothetical protein